MRGDLPDVCVCTGARHCVFFTTATPIHFLRVFFHKVPVAPSVRRRLATRKTTNRTETKEKKNEDLCCFCADPRMQAADKQRRPENRRGRPPAGKQQGGKTRGAGQSQIKSQGKRGRGPAADAKRAREPVAEKADGNASTSPNDGIVKRLPDELWDLVLNGVDASGACFIHPSQRSLLRLVCARWRAIIQGPSPQWARGHLTHGWRCMPFASFERPDTPAPFVCGRDVTLSGAIRFVCGVLEWTPAHLGLDRRLLCEAPAGFERLCWPTQPSDMQHARPVDDSALSAQTMKCAKAYFDTVRRRRTKGGAQKAVDWSTTVSDIVRGLMGVPLAPESDSAEDQREHDSLVHRVSVTLVLLGHPLAGLCYFAQRNPSPIKRRVLYAENMLDLARAIALDGRDDAVLLLAALCGVARVRGISPKKFKANCWSSIVGIWASLAQTQSLESIRTLCAIIDRSTDDIVRKRTSTASCMLCDTVPIDLNDPVWRLLRKKRDPPKEDRWGGRSIRIHWLDVLLHLDQPAPVLGAHGARVEDATFLVHALIADDRRAAAESVLDFIVQKRGADAVFDDVQSVHRIATARMPFTESLPWLARHGYEPQRGHLVDLAAMVIAKSRCMYDIWMFITTVANVWRAQLGDDPDIVGCVLGHMIETDRWDCARNLVALLAPILALPRTVDDGREACHPSASTGLHRQRTVWQRVLCGDILPKTLSIADDPGNDAVVKIKAPKRAQVLLELLRHYDAPDKPLKGAVWRLWCGEPEPITPVGDEYALCRLAQCGLVNAPN